MDDVQAGASANEAMVATEDKPPVLDQPQLKDTGNGPSVSYEEPLLAEYYGEPDADGVYGAAG